MRPPSAPNLLVVEDDRSLREAILELLTRNGFVAVGASDGQEADQQMAKARFDLVVLDLMMPGEDGLSICRRLQHGGPPVLMISAVGEAMDRVVGLEVGAADYLSKPFEPRELVARIRAILRRPSPADALRSEAPVRFAGLTYDFGQRLLLDATGRAVPLTSGELRLLEAFLTRPGRLLSRDLLLDLSHRSDGPYDRAVDLAISRLRRKLSKVGANACIETVRGEGYRFIAPVAP